MLAILEGPEPFISSTSTSQDLVLTLCARSRKVIFEFISMTTDVQMYRCMLINNTMQGTVDTAGQLRDLYSSLPGPQSVTGLAVFEWQYLSKGLS